MKHLSPLTIVSVVTMAALFIPAAQAAETCKCLNSSGGLCTNMICTQSSSSTTTKTTTKKKKTQDVSVRITNNSSDVLPGDTVSFKIKITNDNDVDAQVDVVATLDRYLTFVSASDSGDDVSSSEIDWDSVDISANDTLTLTFRARVKTNVPSGRSLKVQVDAGNDSDSANVYVSDINCNNNYNNGNSSSYYNGTNCCNNGYSSTTNCNNNNGSNTVTMNVTTSSDTVQQGGTLTYILNLNSNANYDATTNIYATLDPNTTFVAASDGATSIGSNVVQWNNLRINQYSSKQVTLQVRVSSNASLGSSLYFQANANGYNASKTTTVGTTTGGDICTYYNTYLRVNYDDYCDSRHQHSVR